MKSAAQKDLQGDREKPAPALKIGRRESNKRENLRRIKMAAQECFIANGFHDATMRDIAARAGVGIGTLFRYATNKHDLLLLSVIEDVENAAALSQDRVVQNAPLVDNIFAILEAPFEVLMNREHPSISQIMLSELYFYTEGALAKRFHSTRSDHFGLMREAIEFAADTGEIQRPCDVEKILRLIHAIYHGEIRYSLTTQPVNLIAARGRLMDALQIFIQGPFRKSPDTKRELRRAGGRAKSGLQAAAAGKARHG